MANPDPLPPLALEWNLSPFQKRPRHVWQFLEKLRTAVVGVINLPDIIVYNE